MKKRNLAVLVAAMSALLALAVPTAMSAGVKTTVTLGAAGYQGKVSSANSACVANRTVVLKQKGNGVISRAISKENGNWKADLDELNEKIKIPAMVYAEVKASSPAGPVASCSAATSKTVEIAGG